MNAATIFSTIIINYVFALSAVICFFIYGLPFAPVFVLCHKRMRTKPEKKTRYIVVMSIIAGMLALLVVQAVGLLIDMNMAQTIYHNGVAEIVNILTEASF